jgi:hypothetical protein
VLLDGRLPSPDLTYRALVQSWVGEPHAAPRAAARVVAGRETVYASWNGSTKLAAWRVLGGSSTSGLHVVAHGPKRGFETALRLPRRYAVVRVQALDAGGQVLAASAVTAPR